MDSSKKLQNKVALVTGASKGIGAGIALHLAEAGASVVVNYSSSKEGADKIVNEIVKKGGKAIAVKANARKPEEIKVLISETVKTFGKLDILVNNAGVYEFAPLEEVTKEHFDKMFDLNVFGLLLVTKEAAKHMKNGGSIINISSIASTHAIPTGSVYCATKASVDAITRCLAEEFGPRNIRINSVNPGMVETEGLHSAGITEGEFKSQYLARTALGRLGQPKDIAPAVVFLASDDASWITGETLFISGGNH